MLVLHLENKSLLNIEEMFEKGQTSPGARRAATATVAAGRANQDQPALIDLQGNPVPGTGR